MKDILDKLKLIESEKPKAALLNKKFSSFRDMEQLQGDAKITTAHKPVKMGDKQKGLTGKLVGTSEAVENTVEDLVAKLGSEFKSQFLGDKTAKKDRDLANAPKDKEIGKKKPAKDIHVKEQGVAEGVPQTLRKVVPGYAKREIDKKMDAGKFGKTDADKDANFQRYKKIQDKLNEFAPDGFNGGDDDEGFNPDIAKMAQEDGFTKGVSLVDGATLEMAMKINYWHSQHGGMYKQYFAKGFKQGRMNKVNHNNKQYNLNLKLMKDGSIRHGEQGVAEGTGNIGSAIKSLYQKIYNAGEDEIEYFYHDSPIFAQYWDEYEGDLDSIIAEVDPKELQVMLAELESYVQNSNLSEGLGDDERRAFKRQELQHELGHEKNNIQVVINGKPWKVFAGKGYADSPEEYRHLQSMKAWAAKKSAASGKKWEVYLTGSPVSEGINEGVEMDMDSASPIGSMPADDIPEVQHVTEDWGSSDWHPVMKGMWDVIDRHYAGRANPESIEDAAQNAAEFYYDDMGYDDVEEAKDRIIGMFLRRPDGIGRKQEKTPDQELEEAGVVPTAAPASPEAAGLQGQLNIKQLASILPGIDSRQLGMAIATLKGGNEPSMVQQKALAGAFAALVKADPQTTSKAMAVLKKVSSDTTPTPAAAKPAPGTPALGTTPAPAPTAPVGTPAAAPAAGAVPAKESEDYIKENKRK